jgi:hypothetical protein
MVQFPSALSHHIFAAKQDTPTRYLGVFGHMVHNRKGERAFAATRLPDQPKRVAGPDLKRDIPDGFDGSQSRRVNDSQVLHF